jgi:hypothetical protein
MGQTKVNTKTGSGEGRTQQSSTNDMQKKWCLTKYAAFTSLGGRMSLSNIFPNHYCGADLIMYLFLGHFPIPLLLSSNNLLLSKSCLWVC